MKKLDYIDWIILTLLGILMFSIGGITTSIFFAYHPDDITLMRCNLMSIDTDKITDIPKDRINESQIRVYDNYVIIEVNNSLWSKFVDSGSMRPLLDKGANGIHIIPDSPDDLQVGDVISFRHPMFEGITVIHRIIETGEDEEGWFAIAMGDNNQGPDPEKIRFEHIRHVLIAIIY